MHHSGIGGEEGSFHRKKFLASSLDRPTDGPSRQMKCQHFAPFISPVYERETPLSPCSSGIPELNPFDIYASLRRRSLSRAGDPQSFNSPSYPPPPPDLKCTQPAAAAAVLREKGKREIASFPPPLPLLPPFSFFS